MFASDPPLEDGSNAPIVENRNTVVQAPSLNEVTFEIDERLVGKYVALEDAHGKLVLKDGDGMYFEIKPDGKVELSLDTFAGVANYGSERLELSAYYADTGRVVLHINLINDRWTYPGLCGLSVSFEGDSDFNSFTLINYMDDYSFDYICEQAEKLKAKYDETNPFRLANYMGIKVFYAPMGRDIECCKGFYLTHSRIRTMTLNSDLSSDFKRIICSHELGHAVLHNKEAGMKAFHDFGLFDTASAFEYEANMFAAELLLEDEDVLERLNDDLSFFQAASELNVPAEILDFKFRTMKWKGYKIREAPLLSPGNWLKCAADGGCPDDFYGA